jgi:hypothetical protein
MVLKEAHTVFRTHRRGGSGLIFVLKLIISTICGYIIVPFLEIPLKRTTNGPEIINVILVTKTL